MAGCREPKNVPRPASAAANRFSILEIHRPVLDAGHNDDHPAFQKYEFTEEGREGGGKSST